MAAAPYLAHGCLPKLYRNEEVAPNEGHGHVPHIAQIDDETASASFASTSGALLGDAVFAAYLVVTPPSDFGHLVIPLSHPLLEIPIYRGDLDVTALARHTPHP